MKQERQKRRLTDNLIELAGNPTDCIRIHYKYNDEGDIESRIIENATVESVIFPPLKDVPYRKLTKEKNSYKITSLVNIAAEGEASEKFTLTFTHASGLSVGDLIVRVFLDPDVEKPIILVLMVKEVLGTFGHQMLLTTKCNATLDMETLPEETEQVIGQMAERRLHIRF